MPVPRPQEPPRAGRERTKVEPLMLLRSIAKTLPCRHCGARPHQECDTARMSSADLVLGYHEERRKDALAERERQNQIQAMGDKRHDPKVPILFRGVK